MISKVCCCCLSPVASKLLIASSQTIEDSAHAIDNALDGVQVTINRNVNASAASFLRQHRESYEAYQSSLDEHSRIKRARTDVSSDIQSTLESTYSYMQSTLASTSRDVDTFSASISSSVRALYTLSIFHLTLVVRFTIFKPSRTTTATKPWEVFPVFMTLQSRLLKRRRKRMCPQATRRRSANGSTLTIGPSPNLAKNFWGLPLHLPPLSRESLWNSRASPPNQRNQRKPCVAALGSG